MRAKFSVGCVVEGVFYYEDPTEEFVKGEGKARITSVHVPTDIESDNYRGVGIIYTLVDENNVWCAAPERNLRRTCEVEPGWEPKESK